MWTRNYDIFKVYASLPAYKMESDFTESARPYVVNTSGGKVYLAATTSGDTDGYGSVLNANWVTTYHTSLANFQATVDVGTDGTADSYTDYELGSPLTTSSITKTIIEVGKPVLDLENHKWKQKVSIDFKNITAEDIIIKEWGIFWHMYNGGNYLLKREVLAQADWKTVPANSYCRVDFEYDVEFTPNLTAYNNGDTITDSWDTIITNATAGTVDGYSIGDTKTLEFTYNEKKYIVQAEIIGKAHDTISGTENKAALTWLFKPLVWTHNMNSSNTNSGGWMAADGDYYESSRELEEGVLKYGCAMRKWIDGLVAGFPTALQNAIKIVDKQYDAANVVRTARDKLWIPSITEVGLSPSNSIAGQGTAYDCFSSNAARIKANMGGNQIWWTRSRYTSSATYFWTVTSDGTASNRNASDAYGVALGFCI